MDIANKYIIAEQNENGEMVEREMTPDEIANYDQLTANSVLLETAELPEPLEEEPA
jgi:hypothetical protein